MTLYVPRTVTLNSVKKGQGDSYLPPKPGNIYLYFNLTATNTDTSNHLISVIDFSYSYGIEGFLVFPLAFYFLDKRDYSGKACSDIPRVSARGPTHHLLHPHPYHETGMGEIAFILRAGVV